MNAPPASSAGSGRPKRRVTGFPIKVAEWRRNGKELVRIAIDHYDGIFTIDIRTWWRDLDGNFKPKKNGLTLPISQLPTLTIAVTAALRKAESLCLIEEKGKR
jgi:hypothetical protein